MAGVESRVHVQVREGQLRKAARGIGEPVGEFPYRPPWTRRQAGARDAQGEGQMVAVVGDRLGGAAFGGEPPGSGPETEDLDGRRGCEGREMEVYGAVEGGEDTEAGDVDRTAVCRGQERTYLGGVQRVVQDDQHPSLGEQR
ncbi:hypothetical protein ACFU9Y_32675 [Streptomyces sp. NPDC057621]|uniref:hypothetical protein n=1 Tax=Streptomyces sp. NPDC057621 TaxID=3346186 RepID=UPI00368FD1F8